MKISPELRCSITSKIKPQKKYFNILLVIRRYFVDFWLKIRSPLKKNQHTKTKKIDFNKAIVKKMTNFILVVRLILRFVAKLKIRISSRKIDFLSERIAFFINDPTHLSQEELIIKFKFLSNKKIQSLISKR